MIRFHSQRRLYPDDFILILGCLNLIASQTLLHVLTIDVIFWMEGRNLDPNPQNLLASVFNDPELLYRRVVKIRKMLFPCFALTWTSIFAVKICFLLICYQIISRIQRFIIAWKIIFGLTLVIWIFCICGFVISCPHFGLHVCKSALPPPTQFCSLLIIASN